MPSSLTIGVVQFSPEAALERNRDKFVRFISKAKAEGCRVVVFPEGALHSPPETSKAKIEAAIQVVQAAAAENGTYVVMGLDYRLTDTEPLHNRLLVLNPDGYIIHCYDKIWGDPRFPNVPGLFHIDTIPCCAILCADRWARGVEELPVFVGAQIIFECSNNYDNEWIPDLGWYWQVPRALRNGAYVIFCNTPRERPGIALEGREWPGHGHSAIIAPDGMLMAAAAEEADRLLVVTIEPERATRNEALRRCRHPLFSRFWDIGIQIINGGHFEAPAFEPLVAQPTAITIAAVQMACSRSIPTNLEKMRRLCWEARWAGGADVIVFPELAVTGANEDDIRKANQSALASSLVEMKAAARAAQTFVTFGMPYTAEDGRLYNSAFVLGVDGTLLTRYDQLVPDRPNLFAPGMSTRAMWFQVNGVPAVVTIGHDALWSELAELAAVRGAQIHLHLCYDRDTSPAGGLLRKQLWINVASFKTFTATVNAASPASVLHPSAPANGGSMIWQDFHRAATGSVGGYAPHSAVRLVEAGEGETILYATQLIPPFNPHFGQLARTHNPQMKAWYIAGAQAIYDSQESSIVGK